MKNILLLIVMSIKLLIRGLFLLCLAFGPLIASTGNAQVKSIDEVFITLSKNNYSLIRFFRETEKQTDFKFFYTDKTVNTSQEIGLVKNSGNVEEFLIEIAKQTNLRFRQVNNAISVIPGRGDKGIEMVQIELNLEDIVIQGTVRDANNEPIPGVTVSVPGTSIGTATNLDGNYSLSVPEGATLVFSFIGFISQRITVGDQSIIDVILNEDLASLDEVVVVGYGTQKRSDITGSVSSIPKERLEMVPNLNVAQAIQGSMPGVLITQTGAGASPSQSVMVRGRNSIKANNDPLVIVDGIPGGLLDVNPNDVESIEILRDASAAAIYGSRGANGVILITTKMGLTGKPKISYDGYFSIQEFDNLPPIMDGGQFYNFKQVRDQSSITGYEIERFESGDWVYWPDHAFRNGSAHQHSLSVSGATDNTKYYISGGFFDVKGIAVNDNFQRFTSRINVDTKMTDWLSLGTRTQLAYEDRSGVSPSIGGVFTGHPLGEVYDQAGNLTLFPVSYDPQVGNPLEGTLFDDTNKSYQVFTNNYMDVSLPFFPGLKYRLNTGVRIGFNDIATYMGRNTKTGFDSRGRSVTERSQNTKTLIENILTYDKDFGKHGISSTFLYSSERNWNAGNQLTATAFPSDLLKFYAADQAELLQPVYTYLENAIISQMMRLNYSFQSKYLFTFTARRDGYSGFGEKTKWGIFPSVAAGWNIADEDFFPLKNTFSELKLRASYGLNGNQAVDAYETIARLSNENANMVSLGNSVPGFFPSKLAQDNLGWESSGTYNLGLDFGLFENRIQGDLNVFKTNTMDLILDRTISHVHGITSITQNIGETENKGFEFSLNSVNVSNQKFKWNSTANLSYIDNKIVSLYGVFDDSGKEIDDITNAWFIGQPINVNFHYKWAGIWQLNEADEASGYGQQPGFVKVEDLNDDGTINAADRQIIGQTDPRFLWGLTNTFSYGNFMLNIFLHGVHGVTKDNVIKNDHALAEVRHNQTRKDWWTPDNPQATWITNHYNAQLQGGLNVPFYENASFVRLKDISLSYNFPTLIRDRMGLGQLRIYLTGRNLMTFTNWEGLDPELSSQRSIPLQREYVVGLNLGF